MAPELVDYVERVRQPYNVNAVAQAAAIGALSDQDHVEQSRVMNRQGMAQLEAGFQRLGLSWVPSQANFIVVRTPMEGGDVQSELRKRGVLVRAMAGYGESRAVRITVGTEAMNQRTLTALADVLKL
jgi:histidinol-phosphate aminotransferase